MPPLSPLEHSLWILEIIANGAVAWRLYSIGAHRKYRFFFLYLLFGIMRSVLLLPFNPNQRTYSYIWVFSKPIIWLFYILIVLELHSLVLQKHRGIYSFGRWLLYGGMAVSISISALALIPQWGAPHHSKVLDLIVVIERGLISSLLIFLFILVAFLNWCPIPLSRNLILHCIVYSIFFLAGTMTSLYREVTGFQVNRTYSTIKLIITIVCQLAWFFFLTRRGETETTMLRKAWQVPDERGLMDQLAAINSSLLRTARK